MFQLVWPKIQIDEISVPSNLEFLKPLFLILNMITAYYDGIWRNQWWNKWRGTRTLSPLWNTKHLKFNSSSKWHALPMCPQYIFVLQGIKFEIYTLKGKILNEILCFKRLILVLNRLLHTYSWSRKTYLHLVV